MNDHEDSIEDAPSITRMRRYALGWSRQAEAGVELLVRSGLAQDPTVQAAWSAPGCLEPDVLAAALRGPLTARTRHQLVASVALSLLAGDLHPLDLTAETGDLDAPALELVMTALAHAHGLPRPTEP